MARLARLFTIGITVAVAIATLAGCRQSLAVKDSIVKAVDAARSAAPSLTLWDGTTQIAYGGTATWADTMFTTTTAKTFTIKNEGSLDLTLSGATPVTITGTGQAAYASITQPAGSTIAAGASATFTVTFNPPGQGLDYPATLAIASNDPTHASYTFSATGHSSEWHGVKTILGKAVSAAKAGCSGDNVYVVYYDENYYLTLVKSSDRGSTWGSPQKVYETKVHGSYISMAVDGSNIYIVYQNNSTNNDDYFCQVTDSGSAFPTSNTQKISSGDGYESSITYDTTNIYIAYNALGGPSFTYAKKGSTFPTPVYIDSSITTGFGYLMPMSIFWDPTTEEVNVSYFDNNTPALKLASFNTASLSQSMSMPSIPYSGYLGPPITSATTPCIAACSLGGNFSAYVSFCDTSASVNSYKLYEYYMHGSSHSIKNDVVTIDSSANVGISGVTIYQNGNLYTAYYDATYSNLKFAIGTQSDPAADYTFTNKAIASAGGGTSFTCSFVSDQTTNFYVVYYDSTAAALKIAKSLDTGATW
jgi:hypothetical protein